MQDGEPEGHRSEALETETVSAWNAPPVRSPRRVTPGNSMPRTPERKDDDQDMNGDGDGDTAENAREGKKKDDQHEEDRRSRSPHRPAPAASAASSCGPAPVVATDPRIDQMQAQVATMMQQMENHAGHVGATDGGCCSVTGSWQSVWWGC